MQAQNWTQIGDGIDGDDADNYFGWSVDLSADGSVISIGAPGNNYVRVFQNDSGIWTPLGNDITSGDYGEFGGSVCLSADGSVIAIGCTGDDGNVYVRVYSYNSGSWTQVGTDINGGIAGPGAVDDYSGATVSYGYSVSINADGSIVAVGATGADDNAENSGHVRVFQNFSGTWAQIGADIVGESANDESGNCVSLSSDGSIVAIGAYKNGGNGTESGHVRVYQNISGIWTQIGADINGEAVGDWSGFSVSLSSDGTRIAIGAPKNDGESGQVRVYQNISGTWIQIGADIDGQQSGEKSGFSVSLSSDGSIIAIGSPANNTIGVYAGQVRVYKFISGAWEQVDEALYGDTPLSVAGFSVSLISDGSSVAVASPGKDFGMGMGQGQVKIYHNDALGIPELEEADIRIFPNPSKGVFTIDNAESFEVIITDLAGKIVYHSNTLNGNQIHLRQSGMYFIRFISETSSISSKIIVE